MPSWKQLSPGMIGLVQLVKALLGPRRVMRKTILLLCQASNHHTRMHASASSLAIPENGCSHGSSPNPPHRNFEPLYHVISTPSPDGQPQSQRNLHMSTALPSPEISRLERCKTRVRGQRSVRRFFLLARRCRGLSFGRQNEAPWSLAKPVITVGPSELRCCSLLVMCL